MQACCFHYFVQNGCAEQEIIYNNSKSSSSFFIFSPITFQIKKQLDSFISHTVLIQLQICKDESSTICSAATLRMFQMYAVLLRKPCL